MNKPIIFTLGAIVGAAGGSVATYFLTKEMFAQQAAEEIEAYAEHCEDRIENFKLKAYGAEVEDKEDNNGSESEAPLTNDPNEDAINRNEGVKKYHHNDGIDSMYSANKIFASSQNEKEKVEVKKEIHEVAPVKESKLINDIDEEEWMRENGYTKQTLDIFLGDDEDIFGVWGYGTDTEEDADRKWGKPTEDIIGRHHTYDELLSYCKDSDDGIGLAYVKNDELMIDFELVIHDNRDEHV